MLKYWNAAFEISEFELQSRYYIYFRADKPSEKSEHPLSLYLSCPIGWDCRIHQLHLCRGVRHPNECPRYDTKKSDSEVPVMLELWGMRSTPSLPSLPGSLWFGAVAPDKGPIYGLNRIKPWFLEFTDFLLLNCVFMLNWIVWNRTVFDI